MTARLQAEDRRGQRKAGTPQDPQRGGLGGTTSMNSGRGCTLPGAEDRSAPPAVALRPACSDHQSPLRATPGPGPLSAPPSPRPSSRRARVRGGWPEWAETRRGSNGSQPRRPRSNVWAGHRAEDATQGLRWARPLPFGQRVPGRLRGRGHGPRPQSEGMVKVRLESWFPEGTGEPLRSPTRPRITALPRANI